MPDNFKPPTNCAKCGGAMEPGVFMPNGETMGYKGHQGRFLESLAPIGTWWKIEYHESKSLGLKTTGMALTGVGRPFLVIHYRCIECGYLESYAPAVKDNLFKTLGPAD